MPEDDIYHSKQAYERLKSRVHEFGIRPPATTRRGQRKYYCTNPENIKYFTRLFKHFEAKDLSYVRRVRVTQSMKFIVFAATKDLNTLNREDIDALIIKMHEQYKTPISKSCFVRDLKCIWKILFPDKDHLGRPDETVTPYVVRHVSVKMDKSRQKRRHDKITIGQYEQLVQYFAKDPRMQAYIAVAFETLARPQELLYARVRDVSLEEQHAYIHITEHGKEGIKDLLVIDGWLYLKNWLEVHPYRTNPDAWLFVNLRENKGGQLSPCNVTQLLTDASTKLGIPRLSAYSIKRNGVTYRVLKGDSASQIQKIAGWNSTRQLTTYDLSDQADAFKVELAKRGLIQDEKYTHLLPQNKTCVFCKTMNPFTALSCSQCGRPLDSQRIREDVERKENELQELRQRMVEIERSLELVALAQKSRNPKLAHLDVFSSHKQ